MGEIPDSVAGGDAADLSPCPGNNSLFRGIDIVKLVINLGG